MLAKVHRFITAANIAVLLSAGLGSPMARSAQPASDRFRNFDRFVSQMMKQYRVPGSAIAIVENGKVVFIKGYGVRNVTKPGAVDPNTIFQLASVTKTFTAAAAATVVDNGKLSWDKPVVNYLPQFEFYDPYVTRHLTERDLLAMRSGWPAFTGDILDNFGYTREQIVHRLRYLKPKYSFRDVSQYSNPSYFIAGEVAAHASGMSWNTLVEKRLYAPLAMTRSGTSVHDLTDRNSAMGHAIVNDAVVPTQPTNQDTMGAAGAATSTAADMARYLQMYLNNGRFGNTVVLKPESVSEIYKRSMVAEIEFTELPPISERTGFYYGLGFDSFDYGGYHVIEKAGALAGVRTLMTMIPEKHVGIVVLANLNITAFPEALRTYYIEGMVLHRSADADLKEIWARNQKMASMLDPPKPPQNPLAFAGNLSGLTGTYENQLYGRCTISQTGKTLKMACGPAKYSAPLLHWNGGQFIAKWPGATSAGDDITFTIGADGKAVSFNDDPLGLFTRVKP